MAFSVFYFLLALLLTGIVFFIAFRNRGLVMALGVLLLGLVGVAALWLAIVGILLRNM